MTRNLLLGTALQSGLAFLAALAALPAAAQPAANARPTGGSVIAGTAAISRTTSNTQINQSSTRAAIDWKSFDVGSKQSVTFNQPSSSAVALNRVTGPDPSQIAGQITANGQIILLNQSGVNFYHGAQVNAVGVMVSTIGASDQSVKSFVASNAGKLVLDQPGNPNAKVDNQGNITVQQAGLAALVAPQVANSGTITARFGHVVLAGAKTATLDLYGDGLLSLDVTNQVAQTPVDKNGKSATALVTNTGVIIADGGTVQLTARAADGIVQNLVEAGGTIRAATIGDHTGAVALNGVGGSIVVEGQLSVPGNAAGTKGGAVEVVSNANVTVATGARIDASGRAGGGLVAIGTTLARAKGGPSVAPTLTATNATVQRGATIAADAISNGNGGRVTLFATGTTHLDGLTTTKGGAQGGDGGTVEISGGAVSLTGRVNATAPLGATGTLVLDPLDLYVSDNQPAGTFPITSGATITAGGSPDANTISWISPAVLEAQDANISLAASRDLFVATSAGTPNTLNLGSHALTLTAADSLTIDRGFAITAGNFGGGISLMATSGNITLSGSSGVAAGLISSGELATLSPTRLLPGGAATVAMVAGQSILLTDAVMTANGKGGQFNSLDLSAGKGVTQSAAGAINAFTLTSTNGVGGDAILTGTANTFSNVSNFAVSNGNLVVVNASNLTLVNTISGNSLFFEVNSGGGVLTLGTSIDTTGAPATLTGNNGRISLVADAIEVAANTAGSTITAGTVELAPFSPINASLLGTTGLLIDLTLLQTIHTTGGTLEVGGFTNVAAGAIAPSPQASSITIDGAVKLSTTTASTLRLDTTGPITESATSGSIIVTNLTGSAASARIDSPNNEVSNLGDFTTGGDLTLLTGVPLTVDGMVKAGAVAAPNSANVATITLTAFGGLQIGAGTAGIINAGTVTLAANSGSITEPNGAIGANSLSAKATASEGGGSDVLLTSTSNQIAASTGITAGGGNVALVDDPTLLLTGTYTGNNLFFEVTQPGGSLQLGDAGTPATLTANDFLITLVADRMSVGNTKSSITVSFGTLELAPFSPINESVAGSTNTGQLLIDPTLLSIIAGGMNALDTLLIGGFTNQPANATGPTASASGITLDGPINLSNQAFTLNLLANGPITEPGGPLTVSNVIGNSIGPFSLTNPANAITGSFGITAVNGDVVVADQSDLQLFGTQSGNNLFFEVARVGGVLRLGNADEGALLTAGTGNRISLVADRISSSGDNNTISVPVGVLELAPFSPINTSLNGNNAVGQLLIDSALLSVVSPAINTLVIGGFTNEPAGATASSPSAGSVTIDGAFNLAPLATTLDLEAIGPVTQSAPILNVGTLLGKTNSAILGTHLNSIDTLGAFSASSGPFLLNDGGVAGRLTVNGPVTGNSVTIQNAPTISVVGSIGASTTVAITSGNGGIGVATGGIITGPTIDLNGAAGGIALSGNAPVGQIGGVVDLTASGVGVSETGGSSIIAGILQSSGNVAGPVTLINGNTVASIGAFKVTGAGSGFTLVDAAGVNLDVSGPLSAAQDVVLSTSGSGAVTATGSIGAGRTLSATSGSGGISLGTGAVLTGPTIDLNGAAGGIALSGNASLGQTGGLVDLTTTGGGVTEAATAAITAATLQSTGGIAGDVAMAGISNAIADLGSLAVSGGTFSLIDTGNLNVAGKLTASDVTIGDAETLTISNSLIAISTANLTAASIAIPGLVSAGSVALTGTTGPIDETGSLIAGALSGSAAGAASLTGVNQVGALGDFSAGSFALNDSTDLLIGGTLNAARIAILAPANRVSLGDGAVIVTGGTARPTGPIRPALEPANGGPGALLQAASFAQIGSSTVLGKSGGPATLQISITGNAQFDPPLGLAATGTWLILNLTNGTAAGNVFVNALDVTYTTPGSANLFGTIDGVTGGRAASLGFIQPAVNVNYLFNGCVIAAAECTTVSLNTGLTATLGAIYPLLAITPPSLTSLPDLVLVALPMLQPQPPQLTDPDVVPPNITYLDY